MPEVDFTFQSLNMAVALGICFFVIFFMIGKLLLTWPLLDNRLEELRSHYNLTQSSNLSNFTDQLFQLKKKKANKKENLLKKWIMNYILKNPFWVEESVKAAFEQAGWVSKETQFFFISSKLICFLLGIGIGYVVISTRASFAQSPALTQVLIVMLIALSGWIVPDLYLRGAIKNRVDRIEKQFPDALDLIIICVGSGLGLNRAIDRVAKEMVIFGREIAHELTMTNIELEIMLDRRQALQNLYKRVPSPMIRIFTTTLLQSIQQGTPILQALDLLSKEIRSSRMQRAEEKAAKLPSLLVIPLVLFVLPNLFIVLLGPAIVRLINVT